MNQHINDLQTSFSYGEYLKQYIDESVSPLANLGQRFGINASGIKYIKKTCNEIFGLNIDNPDNYLLELNIKYNSLFGKLINKNEKTSENIDINMFENGLNINDIENIDINNLINYSFNDIDKISDDSYILINNSLFTGFIKGRLNQEINDSKLIYFQYDVDSNILLHNITTQYYGKLDYDENLNQYDDWYIIYKLDYVNKEDNNLEYNLNIYLYRLEWLTEYMCNYYNNENNTEYKNLINNFYNFNSSSIKNELFSPFNDNFEDYNNFENINNSIDQVSFLNFIFLYNEQISNKSVIFTSEKIHITDNEINKNDISNILNKSKISGYISKSNISLYFYSIQNLYNIYYQLYINYNQKTYFNVNDNLYIYKYIIYKLYVCLFNEYNNGLSDSLYIPLSYGFNCFINDQTQSLYYINNIYVKFLNDSYSNIELKNKNQIYYNTNSNILHTSVYNVNVDYNNDNSNIINNININKLYTLPYINKLNNWVIDDTDIFTSISQDKYTGIKELYIYTSSVDKQLWANVLNISEDFITKYFDFVEREFIINPNLFFSLYGIDITCKTLIPNLIELTDDNSFFKNTMIISITDKNVLEDEYANNYIGEYIYSLWKFNESTNSFEIITLNNNYAFDPYNNILSSDKEQTNKFVLSTSKLINKNQSSIIKDNNYLIIRNKQGSNYHQDYYNDYNLIFEYVSNVNKNGSNPKYNANKFIDNLEDTPVTNVIYPIYNIIFSIESINELRRINQKYYKPSTLTYISIFINGEQQVFEELKSTVTMQSYYNTVDSWLTDYKVIEVGILESNYFNAYNYNEYVFNKNVPTIDFKETFIRNVNTLNRINLLGIKSSNTTEIYNGFIGNKYDNVNKDILYISTSNSNINIGNDTLLDINQYNKFKKYKTLQIDEFKNVNINVDNVNIGNDIIKINDKNIELNTDVQFTGNQFINQTYNDIITKSISIIPQGFVNNNIYIKHDFGNSENLIIDTSNIINDLYNTLFIPIYGKYTQQNNTNNNEYGLFYNSINLNVLFNQLFGSDFTFDDDQEFIFDKNKQVLNFDINGITYYLLLFKDNNISNQNDIQQLENITNLYNTFKVINYKLNITIVEENNIKKIYINFDNTELMKLDKTLPDNKPSDVASLTKILDKFNQIYG